MLKIVGLTYTTSELLRLLSQRGEATSGQDSCTGPHSNSKGNDRPRPSPLAGGPNTIGDMRVGTQSPDVRTIAAMLLEITHFEGTVMLGRCTSHSCRWSRSIIVRDMETEAHWATRMQYSIGQCISSSR